jgi:hypothetical protein
MSYDISTLKSDLTTVLHGTNLNKVTNLYGVIERASRKLLNDIDTIETTRILPLASPIFDRVYDYACPTDLKGDRVIDIRPQVNRALSDRFFQTYNEQFDLSKAAVSFGGEMTVQYNTGIKSLRLAKNLIPGILVNAIDSITENGTWAVGGDATDLTVDTVNYVYGSGSLRFNVSGVGTTAYLENSTQTAIDLTRDLDQGYEFLYGFIPQGATVTDFTLRWGSSSSDYWESTVTVAQNNAVFQTGWNLLAFPWATATQTGTPDVENITYLRTGFTYDGDAAENFRFNSLVSQLGTIYEIEYYSKYLFRDADTGVFQENITEDSNIINLDTDSYNLLLNLTALFCAQGIQGANMASDIQFFTGEYAAEKSRYTAKIKSQTISPSVSYYKTSSFRPTRARYSSS